MGSHSPIELDDDVIFVENEWINQGEKNTNVPPFVRWKKDKDMEIPLSFLQCIKFPNPDISVNEFLAYELPRVSSEIISNKVAKWFSQEPPSILNMQILLKRSIPSSTFLTQLEEASGQAWLDGAKSVVDWRINDGAGCLPLWIVMFWREVERLNRIQLMWKQSLKWVSNEGARKQ